MTVPIPRTTPCKQILASSLRLYDIPVIAAVIPLHEGFRPDHAHLGIEPFDLILYYLMVGFVVVLIVWNLLKSHKWQEELLYVIVLLPFLLRLLRLK